MRRLYASELTAAAIVRTCTEYQDQGRPRDEYEHAVTELCEGLDPVHIAAALGHLADAALQGRDDAPAWLDRWDSDADEMHGPVAQAQLWEVCGQ
jgi:hypothetical protein